MYLDQFIQAEQKYIQDAIENKLPDVQIPDFETKEDAEKFLQECTQNVMNHLTASGYWVDIHSKVCQKFGLQLKTSPDGGQGV